MGKLEKKSQKHRRKENLQKGILMAVGAVGFLSVALVAPNVLQILGRSSKKFFKNNIYRSRDRLIEKGLLVFVKKGNKKYLQLTKKGKRQLLEWGILECPTVQSRRWDKKWRILSFDIWERRREVRNKLRLVLKRIGFYPLHQSLWVYPYDCEDFIQLLKTDLNVGRGVLYVIADQIENDRALRDHFNLGD